MKMFIQGRWSKKNSINKIKYKCSYEDYYTWVENMSNYVFGLSIKFSHKNNIKRHKQEIFQQTFCDFEK